MMKHELSGIAFDLDGTLYPNHRLFIRLLPFVLKHGRLLQTMGKARTMLRAENRNGPFYDLQARIIAEFLREDPETVKEKLERLIYRGWEPLFRGIKPYAHVRETLEALRQRGFKLGILSDFPPAKKLEYLGLGEGWDTVLCSEDSGRLKPDPLPFSTLAASLGLPPDRILYVGNSLHYDMAGAQKAGMRTALIRSRWKKYLSSRIKTDFMFSDYRQLYHYVISF
ncbi:MAG: HAD family hydrolase [Spirochaetaceae bacterium]|jgi:putative hydrolase of the HAD superfamily|nr:HAD family hydrolase [Spirochaetaceae bacterium]